MAHGLRKIVNSSYMPSGSGRDWFFIGDFNYKNGRRTPDPNVRWAEAQKGTQAPKRKSKGQPQEMAFTKSRTQQLSDSTSSAASLRKSGMSPRMYEKLIRQQSEPTVNDVLTLGSTKAVHHTARWKQDQSSARDFKARNYLRSAGPKDTEPPPPGLASSSYSELGQVHKLGHSYSFSEYGRPEKFLYHSAKPRHTLKDHEVDEHMKEFPGKQKWPPAQADAFYKNALEECERPVDKPISKTIAADTWGHRAKHHTMPHKMGCYPPRDVERDQPEKATTWRPSEYGVPDKHRYHQPPLWAPKEESGMSRIPPGKECEIPHNWKKPSAETMVSYCSKNSTLKM